MKIKTLLACVCLSLTAGLHTACSDEEEIPVIENKLNELKLEIIPQSVTTSTFDFEVEASDESTPYVCLYVPRTIIDRVPKHELPRYLTDDLKRQAEAEGKDFARYLEEVSHKGNLSVRLDNLAGGTLYEVVAFALTEAQRADRSYNYFFETLKVMPIDVNFTVEADAEPNVFTITPSVADVKYYLCLMHEADYEANLANGFDDLNIVYSLLNQELEAAAAEAGQDGIVTDEEMQNIIDKLLWKGKQRLRSNFTENARYRWLILPLDQFGWELVPVDDLSAGWIIPNPSSEDENLSVQIRTNLNLPFVKTFRQGRPLPVAHIIK